MASSSLPGDEPIGRDSDSASFGPAPNAPDPVAAEIESEIADHLATAAERHQVAGLTKADSREKAKEAFGDVGEIGRRCYWIKQGDSLMFRGAVALLLVVLAVSLVVVTLRSWQAESRMADQIGALTAQLKELAERKQPVVAPVAPGPIEITGHVFGGPTKLRVPISVIDVAQGKTVRQVMTDSDGAFSSGPLAGGDFALVAPLQTADSTDAPLFVQSAPIAAYAGVNVLHQELDVGFHYGRLGIELSRPLPEFEVEGQGKFESRIFIKVLTPRLVAARWTASSPMPPEWPVYSSGGPRSRVPGVSSTDLRVGSPVEIPDYVPAEGLWFYEILDNGEIDKGLAGTLFTGDEGRLPSGECLVVAAVLAQVSEPAADPERGPTSGRGGGRSVIQDRYGEFGPYPLRQSSRSAIASDDYQWTRHIWYDLLNRLRAENRSSSRIGEAVYREMETFAPAVAVKVPIIADSKTKMRLEIPNDLESHVRDALTKEEVDVEKAKAAWSEGSPFHRHLKITVVGSEPLESKSAPSGVRAPDDN